MNLLKKIKSKNFIAILLVVVILFNVVSPNIVTPKAYAWDALGILLWPLSALVSALGTAAITLLSGLFFVATDGGDMHYLFIDDIVYNKTNAFQVNLFDSTKVAAGNGKMEPLGYSGVFADAVKNGLSTDAQKTLMSNLLPSIQKWYYTTRTIAIAAAFVILIYVAIKILISTAAGDKAKYKTLLKDWLLSLLLVFAMHYIMAGILYVADSFTNLFATMGSNGNIYGTLMLEAVSGKTESILYGLMMWVLIGITLAFIVIYAKRVVMIAFLTVFAPLVAISYSVDKIRDGKSQILDKWMREYIYTALMMPLDALLYTILSDAIVKNLEDGGNFIVSVALVVGYLPLRGWFNEFLGTDKAGHGMKGVAAGALLGSTLSKFNKGDSKGKKDSGGGNTSNESNSGSGSGSKSSNINLQSKGGANPAISGGANTPRVSSPTSAAASSSGNSSSSSSGSASGNNTAQRALAQARAGSGPITPKQPQTLGQRAGNLAKGAGSAYLGALGKGFSMMPTLMGAALGAASGDVGATVLMGRMGAKAGNAINSKVTNGHEARVEQKANRQALQQATDAGAFTAMQEAEDAETTRLDNITSGIGNNTMNTQQDIIDAGINDEEWQQIYEAGMDSMSDREYQDLTRRNTKGGTRNDDAIDVEIFRRGLEQRKGAMIQEKGNTAFTAAVNNAPAPAKRTNGRRKK